MKRSSQSKNNQQVIKSKQLKPDLKNNKTSVHENSGYSASTSSSVRVKSKSFSTALNSAQNERVQTPQLSFIKRDGSMTSRTLMREDISNVSDYGTDDDDVFNYLKKKEQLMNKENAASCFTGDIGNAFVIPPSKNNKSSVHKNSAGYSALTTKILTPSNSQPARKFPSIKSNEKIMINSSLIKRGNNLSDFGTNVAFNFFKKSEQPTISEKNATSGSNEFQDDIETENVYNETETETQNDDEFADQEAGLSTEPMYQDHENDETISNNHRDENFEDYAAVEEDNTGPVREIIRQKNNSQQNEDEFNEQQMIFDATNNDCICSCRDLILLLLNKINRLTEIIMSNPNVHTQVENFHLLPPLPFITEAALTSFDERLQTEQDLENQFEKKLKSLGGTSLTNIVHRMMSMIIDDELCKTITWSGLHNTLKVKELIFPDIVKRATRSSIASTESEVEEKIKDWLRRPSDRIAAKRKALERRQRKNN